MGNATQLMSFALVTLVAVVVPLGVSLKGNDIIVALEYLLIAFPWIVLLPFTFLIFKYNEYKDYYKEFMVRNIINHAYCSLENGSRMDLDHFLNEFHDQIRSHIIFATGIREKETDFLLGKTKGEAYSMSIYCEE